MQNIVERPALPLANQLTKPAKKQRGRTPAGETPLLLRHHGARVDEGTREWMQERLGRQLGKFALHIESIEVRISDVNGPKGGVDMACQISVILSGLPRVVLEEQGTTAREAFDLAAGVAERAVRRRLGRSGARTPRRLLKAAPVPSVETATADAQEAGVIQATEGALDANASMTGTGTRNTKLNTAGMSFALEDSAQDRPSRKSTRRSENHIKPDSNLKRRETRRTTSPKARATRAQAHT